MRAYGTGCTAALTAIALRNAQARREIPRKAAAGVLHVFRLNDRVKDNSAMPAGLFARDVGGMLMGPWLYMKGRRRARRIAG
jgi:hypothetical protein